jgi:hypothetical protein
MFARQYRPIHIAWSLAMSSLDLDLDSQMSSLESEWRQAYESSIAARAELRALGETSARPTPPRSSRCASAWIARKP